MDKMHVIMIDDDFDEELKKFQKNLKEGEQIVSQAVVNNKLLVVTREAKKDRRNLLLEEHSK